ncbi:Ig-like domain-containing protein [Pseudomonas sp. URMO17WK12:I11]|uniref:Ig-like domain-containing protein n=1 Tax=Pseudomonas sp. URMO17WK12:I11 TaxID=1283291 RepID=UPI000743763D|nr:Ig-like domain-containing protein [Pseudomonas sp. URMO17WK12:I11]
MHVSLEGEDPDAPRLIIEDFYEFEGQLIGMSQDSTYHQYVVVDAEGGIETAFLQDGISSPLALDRASFAGFEPSSLPASGGLFSTLVLGLGALGLFGVAAAAGGGGGGSAQAPVAPEPQPPVAPTTPGAVNISDTSGSNNQPILSGSGRPGDTVQILDNGVVMGEVVIGEGGMWTFTPPALADGDHSLTIIIKDPAGNVSNESESVNLKIDTVAPDAPTVNTLPGATSENPTLSGTGTPGETIVIRDNGNEIGTAVVQPDGSWSFTPNPALDEGEHSLTVEAVDAAGNVSAPSDPQPVVIDSEVPDAPTVNTLPGASNENPTLSGTGTPGETIVIRDNGNEIGTAVVQPDGSWSFTPNPALDEGEHSLTVEAVDAAGNVSAPSDPQPVVIDSEVPDAPTVNTLPGASNENPTLSGTGTPGETIVIRDNGNEIGTAVVQPDGSWSFTPNPALDEGEHSLTVEAVDAAGNVSAPSDPQPVVIDSEVPDAPTVNTLPGASNENPTLSGTGTPGETIVIRDNGNEIGTAVVQPDGSWSFTPNPALDEGEHSLTVEAVDAAGNVSAPSAPGVIVIDTTLPDAPSFNALPEASNENPTLSGTGTPGETIVIRDNGGEIGTAVVQPDGSWSFTPNPALDEGEHSLTVEAVDAAGNVSAPSAPGVIVIDTTLPDAPSFNALPEASNENPTLSGTGTPGETIVIRDNGGEIGTAVVQPDGSWSFTPNPALDEGEHSLTVEAVDAAGNVSAPSAPGVIVIDTTLPDAPSFNALPEASNENPTLSGTGTPGETIVIRDNGGEIGTAVVQPDGSWSFTPNPALDEGEHSLTVEAVDAAGNVSAPSAPKDIVIDSEVPDAPTFDNLPGATNENPTLSGTGTPGETIVIRDNGSEIGSVIVGEDGNWSFTPSPALGEGEHSLTVEAVDAAGNVSAPSAPKDIVIDSEVPDAPTFDNLPGATNENPTLSGTGTPGETIVIRDNGSEIGSVIVGEDGNWSFTPSPALGEGEHSLTVEAVDAAGNVSAPSAPKDIVIDSEVPDAPTFDNLPGATNENPTLSGTGTPGETIVIRDNGSEIGSVVVQPDGTWSFTPSPALGEGEHSLTVEAVDAAGNVSAPSAPGVIVIDTTLPDAPSFNALPEASNENPTLSGTGTPGETIVIRDNGGEIGTAVVQPDGSWSFTPNPALDEGEHSLTVEAVDAAGNVSAPSAPGVIVIDTTLPDAPSFNALPEASNENPTLSGTGTPGETIVIRDNGGEIGTAVVQPDGSWSFTPNPALDEGEHSLTVEAVDAAGNVSAPSAPGVIVIDTTLPDAPSFNALPEASNENPTLSGTGTPGETIVIRDNGGEIGTAVVQPDGSWSFTPNPALDEGEHSLTVEAVDAAGNVSAPSAPGVIVIDTTLPDAPSFNALPEASNENPTLSGTGTPGETIVIRDNGGEIGTAVVQPDGSWSFTPNPALDEGEHSLTVEAVDAAGNVSAPSAPGVIVIDTTLPDAPSFNALPEASNENPTLSGTGTPGETIVIRDNGSEIGSVIVGEDGNWSFTPSPALGEGEHSLTVEAVDAAGNVSAPSAPKDIVIDSEVPDAPTFDNLPGATNENPTLSGTGTPGETIVIRDNGSEIGSVIVGEDGNWSFTPSPALGEGEHSLTVEAVDAAGNVSAPSAPKDIVIDSEVPDAPTFDNLPGATNENPTLSGTGTPGETIVIRDNGSEIGSVIVGEDGNWSFTPSPALGEGEHSLTVEAMDAAGNVSAPSAPKDIVIDSEVPDAPTFDNLPGATNENPTLSGTGTPGETIVIRDNGSEIGSVIVGEDGNWSFTPSPALGEGEHSLTVEAVDAAGNVSAPSAPKDIVIDSEVPDAPTFDNLPGATNENPTLSGTGTPGETIVIRDNGSEIGSVIVGEDGNWSFTPSPALGEGEHSLTVEAVDAAGNVSAPSAPKDIVIDSEVPDAPTFDNLPGATNENPTLSGTGTPGETIVIRDNGSEIGSVIVGEDGNWSFTPSPALGEGEHSLTVEAVDAAGNVSAPSAPKDIVIDSEVPDAPTFDNLPGATNENPTLSGTGTPGETIVIRDNGSEIGSVIVGEDGNWSFTPSPALGEGEHSLTVEAVDAAGNVSAPSAPKDIVIDSEVPDAPTFDNLPGATNENPTLSGTGTPGETIVIRDNGSEIGSVIVGEDGTWSFTPSPALGEGEHSLTVEAVDAAGNVSEVSDVQVVEIDTVAPDAPTFNALPGSTNENPTLSGSGTAGETIVIRDNGTEIGSVVVQPDGTWSFTPELGEGEHRLTAEVADAAGNVSASDPQVVVIDTIAPLSVVTLSSVSKDSGFGNADLVTNDGSAGRMMYGTLSAALNKGETVQVSLDNGASWMDAEVSGTDWFAMDSGAHSEDWTILARVVDAAGNIGIDSSATVTLMDAAARPSTPLSMAHGSDGKVMVTFDPQTVKVGDRVVVAQYGVRYEHVLTQAEVVAGAANVQAGHLPERIDFKDFTYTSSANSSSVDFRGMTMQFGGPVSLSSGGVVLKGASGGGHRKTTIEVDGGTNAVSLKLAGADDATQLITYNFYDAEGNLIGTVDKTNHASQQQSGSLNQINGHVMEFVAPEGRVIHSFTIETPTDTNGIYLDSVTVGMGGRTDVMSVAIVDAAGNSSDFGTQAHNTIAQDFEVLSAKTLAIGESRDIGSLTITALLKSFDPIYKQAAGDAAWDGKGYGSLLQVNVGTAVGVDLKGASGTRFTAKFGDINNTKSGQELRFYDADNNLILSVDLRPYGIGADYGKHGNLSWDMPEGTSFTRFEIRGGTDRFLMDNIRIDWVGEQAVVPVESIQQVHGSGYQGDGADNVFNVADVSSLLSAYSNVDGGAGLDTLVLSGANQVLDFSLLSGKIDSMEVLDITGSGNNMLKLSLGDVLDQGAKDLFHTDGNTQMMVRGDSGDSVTLDDMLPNGITPGEWASVGAVDVGGVTYNSYQYSTMDVELLVQQGVTVNPV